MYWVYSDAACTTVVLKLPKTDKTGYAESADDALSPGTYYIKEHDAPTGYTLDETVYPVTVTAGKKAAANTKPLTDEPQFTEVDALVEKLDNKGQVVPNAIFKACFYDGSSADATKLKKTWYLKSNSEGKVYLNLECLQSSWNGYSSDSFYTHNGKIVLPIGGYLTIQEVESPARYILDDTVYDWTTTNQKIEVKKVYNTLDPVTIYLKKYDSDGKTPLAGVTFELYFKMA